MPVQYIDRMGWVDEPLTVAWPGFELCYECDGTQLCAEAPHAYCKGWCHFCGGAGQWPLDDAATVYFAPAVPQIDLEYVEKHRKT